MTFEIIATGRAVPPKRVTNEELSQKIDTTDEWIRSHTGIGARHLAEEDTACSDLAVLAARSAISQLAEKTGEDPLALIASIDLIILATSTPDYPSVPASACVVQHKIGARNAAAFDISACCTGLIYALEAASGLLAVNEARKRALVIGAEVLSRIVDWTDRASCVLFGDGAGAVILEKTSAERGGAARRGLVRCILGADGSGSGALMVKRGGSRAPFKRGEIVESPPHIDMDGRAVYNFAVKIITETIENLLTADGITIDAVRWIIPHQANARIVAAAQKRLGIPEEKIYLNIEEYANTSAASIGIALDELNRKGSLSRGDILLLVGFGAGLSYGGALVVW
ncbi:MAG: ketoacyl-ACP synthase III [Spirochaetaceae bacterium]|jgi:3-oxoacyl-[acyl-carrier-protein] synthase-3|nr:ketoacyl-ACP synthase III [Spirochaetaceae bacterium]